MSSPTEHVRLEIDDGVAVVSLCNPPLNVFDLAMRDGLIEAFAAIADITDVRAMVLRADGRHFSAGADLSEFGTAESIFEARRIRWDRDPWGPLWDSRVPTVAALHGYAVGSGLEMALLCDVRMGSTDTQVGLPETKLGMLPSAGGTQSLARAIGPAAAVPLVATSETIPAALAERRGLLSMVIDDEPADTGAKSAADSDPSSRAVDEAALALAHRWAHLDPAIVQAARTCLHGAGDLPLLEGLAREKRLARRVNRQS